jgi:hypothetical protein
MNFITAVFAAVVLINGSAMAAEKCEVPASLLSSDNELAHVASEIKNRHRLDISVVGTGSSTLPGPDGASVAYPARLQEALRRLLPTDDINVVAHIQTRQTTAEMAAAMKKIVTDDKPALVIWQAGTFDAVTGIELEEFSASLAAGIDAINAAGADVSLMNMQYSPHTESLLNVSAYADVMRFVAQEHGALLFDRLAIMRYWNDQGIFDLYAATKNSDMARRVHDCIGRALASQIVERAHLSP